MQPNGSWSPSAPHPNSRQVRLQLASRFLRRLPIPWARSPAVVHPGCRLQGLRLHLHQFRLPIHSPPHPGHRLHGYLLHQRRSLLHAPMGYTYLYLVPLSQRSGLLYILAAEWVFFLTGKYELSHLSHCQRR